MKRPRQLQRLMTRPRRHQRGESRAPSRVCCAGSLLHVLRTLQKCSNLITSLVVLSTRTPVQSLASAVLQSASQRLHMPAAAHELSHSISGTVQGCQFRVRPHIISLGCVQSQQAPLEEYLQQLPPRRRHLLRPRQHQQAGAVGGVQGQAGLAVQSDLLFPTGGHGAAATTPLGLHTTAPAALAVMEVGPLPLTTATKPFRKLLGG